MLPSFPFPSPHRAEMPYRIVVDAKRTQREEAISGAAAFTTRELSIEDRRIVSSSGAFLLISAILGVHSRVIPACQIVQAIKDSQWTSTQVVTAFIKSAIRAQDETNCITEGLWPFLALADVVLTRWLLSIVCRRAEDSCRA